LFPTDGIARKVLPAEIPEGSGPLSALSFGAALNALKKGHRVRRGDWDGTGKWLVLIRAGNAVHTSRNGSFDMQDCIGLKTAQSTMQPGWVASQADLLANDWVILP
jgi:hypothetical protein